MKAVREIFANKNYLWIFLLAATLSYLVFLYLPVITVPGNDLKFQLAQLKTKDWLLFLLLSLLVAVSFVLQIALWRKKRSLKRAAGGAGILGIGGFSGVTASVFSAATCATCVTALFGFLGIGAVFTLIEYRLPISIGAIVILLLSIGLSFRQLNRICNSCQS